MKPYSINLVDLLLFQRRCKWCGSNLVVKSMFLCSPLVYMYILVCGCMVRSERRVLSHWARFTVRRFICIYLCLFCMFLFHTAMCCMSTVGWTWWDWSLILRTYLSSVFWHCWFDHFTRKKPVPDMTYNVFSVTLNLAQSVIKLIMKFRLNKILREYDLCYWSILSHNLFLLATPNILADRWSISVWWHIQHMGNTILPSFFIGFGKFYECPWRQVCVCVCVWGGGG